tara:strand:+ start:299 stop:1156 length:858 start_codon:yes stop_codon:yes gene_type:complete
MNKLKQNAKILLIIILTVFVAIPFISILSNRLLNINKDLEGFSLDDVDYSMNRVRLVDVSRSELGIGGGGKWTSSDPHHAYCVGDIACSNGGSLEETAYHTTSGPFKLNGKAIGSSYQFYCMDTMGDSLPDSSAVCTGNIIADNDLSFVTFYDNGGNDLSLNAIEGTGFLGVYGYVPLDISDDFVYLYDSSGTVDLSGSPCYLFQTKAECDAPEEKDEEKDEEEEESSSITKCLADNGAVPGDPLCCGQDGVVQNTNYNCPSEYPYCVGYKCGETWGMCSSTAGS